MIPLYRSDVDKAPVPAPAQVALAFVVLKSKPPDATVEKYLSHLRTHIVRESATAREPTSQYLDGASYWKQAYEQAKEEKATLLDRLYELERHKSASMTLSSPVATSPLRKDRKRRRDNTPAAKANSRSKRRANPSKTAESTTKKGGSTCRSSVLLTNEVSTGHTKLLQAFFALRVQLRSQRGDLPVIQSSARRLCHTICVIVKGVRDTEADDGSEADTGLWEALRRIHESILEAMDLLVPGSTQSGGASALVSDLAKVLTEMLKCLRALAVREQPERTGVRTRKRSQDNSRSLATELSQLIASMIASLDLNKELHQELFEALAHVFFEHIGSTLSIAVFSEPISLGESSTIGLLQPQGLLAAEDETRGELATALKEAPYLVTILRTISSFANEKSRESGNLFPSTKPSQKDGYAAAIVTRMQNTMLRGIFGDQDDAFCDKLRRPFEGESTEGTGDMMFGEDEEKTSKWFVGEVWKYIGWDILTKHIS